MTVQPPRPAGAEGTAPVFERQTKTAYRALRVRRFRRDARPACFGGLAPVVALWQAKRPTCAFASSAPARPS